MNMKKTRNLSGLYLLPLCLGIAIFMIYPLLHSVFLSFQDWDLISNEMTFKGFDNYIKLFQDAKFLQMIGNTCIYMASMVVITIFLALLLALWLNRSTVIHRFAQTALFTPYIIAMVSVAMLWSWIMNPDVGLLKFIMDSTGVTQLLSLFGIEKIKWLESQDTALLSLIIIGVWKTLGYNTLILLAGLQGIPGEVYEAARLDKTKPFRKLTRITIPLLSPSLFFLLVVNVTAAFQSFDSVNVLTKGGPMNSTNMLVFWIRQQGFEFYHIGLASVGSVLLFAIIGFITFLNFKFLSNKVHYK